MEKKYKLTDETMEYCAHTLHRIEALIDFGDVKKGDKGGWIEQESNLSQEGDCWIYGRAMVFEDAKVSGDAEISGRAEVYGKAEISGKASITGKSIIYGNAKVFGKAAIFGKAQILGNASIFEKAEVYENAIVNDKACVFGNSKISGKAVITGNAEIKGDAVIKSINDYIVFKNFWSSGRYFTYIRSIKMWKVGCFFGSGEELIKKAYKDSEISGKNYERFVRFVEGLEKELENDLN